MDLFDQIKEKIDEKINPENLVLIDNSKLHKKHKSFDANKFHIRYDPRVGGRGEDDAEGLFGG